MFSTNLSTRSRDGHAVVALGGELDMADAVAVADALTAVAAREPGIIVDLSGLEFIDSSGVAALARGRRQARLAGGDLVLAAPGQIVMRALALTRMPDALSVYLTVEEAVAQARCLQGQAILTPRPLHRERRFRPALWSAAHAARGLRGVHVPPMPGPAASCHLPSAAEGTEV